MKRSTLALAVAGAFALPGLAFAQASTVQIYGNVNVTFGSQDAGVANTGGSRFRIDNPGGTRVGFKGTEAIGGGNSAWFQVESNIGGSDGTAGNTWGSRNSGVGLQGNWGWFVLGQWDAPYKNTAGRLQPFGATSMGGTNSLMQNGDTTGAAPTGTTATFAAGTGPGGVGTGTLAYPNPSVAANPFSFHRRLSNTIRYNTPNFSGFSGAISYQAAEGSTEINDPSVWSLSAQYEAGPLWIGGSYERHKEFNGPGVDDSAWFIGAQYRFGFGLEIGFGYERLEYELLQSAAGAGFGSTGGVALTGALLTAGGLTTGNAKKDNWQLHAQYRTGPHRIGAMYMKADDTDGNLGCNSAGGANTLNLVANIVANCNGGNSGADQWTILYGYSLSKRTEVAVFYSRLSNDAQATYDYSTNQVPAALNANSLGRDPKTYGVHVLHAF